jgi:predicted amidohydrolase
MKRNLLSIVVVLAACSTAHDRVIEEPRGGPDTFRVAAIHLHGESGDRTSDEKADAVLKRNFDRCAMMVRQAARAGAKVIVTPEYIDTGVALTWDECSYVCTEVPEPPTKKPLFDPSFADHGLNEVIVGYSRLAKETDAYIVANVLEHYVSVFGEERYFNTAIAFDPEGRLIAAYRKINLYLWEYRNLWRGYETSYFDTPWGRFGMLLCFDALFPTTWGDLSISKGCDFFTLQSYWEHAPLTGRMAMNMLADFSGIPVVWSNQRRLGLAGDAGVIRPYEDDTAFGLWGPPGVVIANLEIPKHLRDGEQSPVVATTK